MQIHALPAGPIQTNAYLLIENGEGVLIDAPEGIWELVEPILQRAKARLTQLWLTHGHWDHTQGAAEVVRHSGARVLGHPDDRRLYEEPQVMTRFLGEDLNLDPVKVDQWIASGDRLEIGGGPHAAEVRHVPGHCPGNVLFYFTSPGPESPDGPGLAFVGDALFKSSVGRTDLPGGNHQQLMQSIRSQIYTLPDSTVVLPGHGQPTTVGDEKRGNPYVPAEFPEGDR